MTPGNSMGLGIVSYLLTSSKCWENIPTQTFCCENGRIADRIKIKYIKLNKQKKRNLNPKSNLFLRGEGKKGKQVRECLGNGRGEFERPAGSM